MHIRTGLNVRHAEEQLRGTISLPHGLGKEMTVAVFAKGDKAREAQEAGADHVGDDDLAKKIEEGFTDFDVAIATPDMMSVVGKLGRVLGPQGKMPNPKVGTVTDDIAKAVSESKAGKVEYRTDRHAIVHLPIGKADFEPKALLENYAALIDEIVRAKPAVGQGPLPPDRDADHHARPRRARGPEPHPRDRRGADPASLVATFRPRPPAGPRARKSGAGDLMNKEQKAAVVDEIAAQIQESEAVFAVDYRGISVPQVAELRAEADRGRRALPGRQEHPDHPRRRPGRRRRAQGAARGPDRLHLRGRRTATSPWRPRRSPSSAASTTSSSPRAAA